jgi:hypothetical protein
MTCLRKAQADLPQTLTVTVSEAFQPSPGRSIRHADKALHIPRTTEWKILHRRLKLQAYKVKNRVIGHVGANLLRTCSDGGTMTSASWTDDVIFSDE